MNTITKDKVSSICKRYVIAREDGLFLRYNRDWVAHWASARPYFTKDIQQAHLFRRSDLPIEQSKLARLRIPTYNMPIDVITITRLKYHVA